MNRLARHKDWDKQLSGVVPSFVRFQEAPQPLGSDVKSS